MSKPYQVLLVEDDPFIARTLRMSLSYKGFEVTACNSFQQGLNQFRSHPFDVILLDINLPDGNGRDLCQEIRKNNETIPILILTAKMEEESAVQCLQRGADDYIRKPYGSQELAARMIRLLERKKKVGTQLLFSSLKIDVQKRMAWAGDKPLTLGKREFNILTLLVKRSGEAVTRNEILDTLGEEADLYDRTIDSHLSHLRRKLKKAGAITIQILPIYGIGYRLEEK